MSLRGPAYALALWGALLTVPGQVLEDKEDEYGPYGQALRAWWIALRVTYYDYLSDLSVDTGRSVARYCRASFGACLASCTRTHAVIQFVCWLLLLVLSLAVHLPLICYDLLEFGLCGVVGVVVLLLALNFVNLYFRWATWGMEVSAAVCLVGVVAHLCRIGDVEGKVKQTTPRAVMKNALSSMRTCSSARRRREAANLRRLRKVDIEDLDDFHEADDGLDVDIVTDGGRPREAIAADVQKAAHLLTSLQHELDLHPRVHRGRRTSSQGECPESGWDADAPRVLRQQVSSLAGDRHQVATGRHMGTPTSGMGPTGVPYPAYRKKMRPWK
ncbi:hypothetical protein PR003_g7086 [Phytophthora rubi]|uniref:TRP C-terminal domain-containing protein n=1 Tax=Phytophthora rubi TaxID=129364 RepID=A0A6A3LD62_9STRA|nr:hypothetical protein PR001_g15314 [Phytophthora rubi]KAE9347132.1 hypothetical protein PR003_g7086 [Phytophthora rubi]